MCHSAKRNQQKNTLCEKKSFYVYNLSMACSPASQPGAAHYSRSVFAAYSQRAGVCSAHINSLRAGDQPGLAHVNTLGGLSHSLQPGLELHI